MHALTKSNTAMEWVYWPIATGLGLLISIALLLSIPRLDELPRPKPVKIIALDFFEWQPPPKPAPLKPQPSSKPKPKHVPIIKAPPPQPKAPPKPSPRPVLTETEQEPAAQPLPAPSAEPVAPPAPQAEALPQAMPLAKLTAMPRFLHKERPIYPPMMRAAGKEALVKLAVLIDARGNIRDIQIKKSAGSEFDQAAIDAVNKSSFSPGEIEQQAVTVLLTVPVKFQLR